MDEQCLICGKLADLGYCDQCLVSLDSMPEPSTWLTNRRTQLIIELLCLLHGWQGWYINVPKYYIPKRLLMLIEG